MEITHPSWNSQESAYIFTISYPQKLEGGTFTDLSDVTLPDLSASHYVESFLNEFLEKTKRYFVSPLPLEKVKKHLRHSILEVPPFPVGSTFSKALWSPISLKMKSNEFHLYWCVADWQAAEPIIRSDFFRSASPAPQSPEPQSNLRTIHIQNTMDSLVPVGDLPLSDLPPLNFQEESQEKREIRQRIREARLKVELAKLKAKRMSSQYYERYGESAYDSAESSLESSDSDSDGPMGRYSYS